MRLYADATTVLLRNLSSLASLLDSINNYENYEKGSGAKLNRSKSFTLTWVAKMKILSVFFGNVNVQLDN